MNEAPLRCGSSPASSFCRATESCAADRRPASPRRARAPGVVGALLLATVVGCSSAGGRGGDGCTAGDSDGVMGGSEPFIVTVSDTGFAVGGADSGSTERNITVQNLTSVALTVTNVGTRPHDVVVECIPTSLSAGCTQTSCFPGPEDAGGTPRSVTVVPPVAPGSTVTVTFTAPLSEGEYPFISDQPGDDTTFEPDGGAAGPFVGEFNLI